MNTKELTLTQKRMIRRKFLGETRYISIGRSRNSARVTYSTPVVVIPGSDAPPKLCGRPYLKTHFKSGRFEKTLYTPSTMRIEVGELWPPLHQKEQGE